GDVECDAQYVDPRVVAGIHANLAIIERARAQGIDVGPGLSLVVGAENAAGIGAELLVIGPLALGNDDGLVGLHHGKNDVRILATNAQPATAKGPVGQTSSHLRPTHSAVRRFVES